MRRWARLDLQVGPQWVSKPRRPRTETSRERHHRQVGILWQKQHGRCYWCGVDMVLPERGNGKVKARPGNLATVDHLDDRFSAERGRRAGERRRVLACCACNEERGRAAQSKYRDEQRRRSQAGHA